MDNQSANSTHLQAEMSREHARDFVSALAQADTAFQHYLEEGNVYGAAEALCSRTLTLRHMAEQNPDIQDLKNTYLIQALHTAMASVEIATKHSVSTAIPYQNLGKIQQLLGYTDHAIESFQKAVEAQTSQPHPTQNRPGVLANFQEILASSQLAMGDTTALERAEKALTDLEASNEDAYNKAVWLLNGHARVARACREFNPEAARKHVQVAQIILASRDDLELSRHALDDLKDLA